MHKKPVDFRNGLVDPDSLLIYMNGCYCANLVTPNPIAHKTEYHHLYFPLPKYKNNHTDLRIRQLRNSKYNNIEMLSCQEDYYHQQTVKEVPREQINLDAAGRYLEESNWLTNYASTSWLIAEMQGALEHSETTSRTERSRLAARLAILHEMRQQDSEQIGKIEVMAHSIVAGALSRYLKQQPEAGIQLLLDQYMSGNGQVIPTRIYGPKTLHRLGESRLQKRIEAENWIIQKILLTPVAEAV